MKDKDFKETIWQPLAEQGWFNNEDMETTIRVCPELYFDLTQLIYYEPLMGGGERLIVGRTIINIILDHGLTSDVAYWIPNQRKEF